MADDLFTSRLLSGERILWSGNPGRGLLLTEKDTFAIPFSLLWCGFVIFWMIGASRTAGFGPLLFDAILICFGLYNLVGRFLVDAWIRRDLRYAVTNSERRHGHGATTEAWARRSIRLRSSSRLAMRVACSTSFSGRQGETTNNLIPVARSLRRTRGWDSSLELRCVAVTGRSPVSHYETPFTFTDRLLRVEVPA